MNTFLAGGIVLCGGKSSRMGRPKAWLPFGPEVLLQRIVRILDSVVGPLVVVAAPDQELPDLPEHVLVTRDELPGRGPLEGLSAGLHALPESTTVAYLSACDVPFLNNPFINKLISDLEDAFCLKLREHRVEFEFLKSYSTPQRLILLVDGLSKKQKEIS